MASKTYLWEQIRAMPLLGFLWFDPETYICDEKQTNTKAHLKIEFYYHANSLETDHRV